ncbi:MAG: flagellar hook-associated protein FlgK [Rhodospirillum sp.]|nr:flagellar hook-associated protein FlgK [Rhodospirillum sp.]MCF8490660.1 flagellar hook-associated protein FlgK [Rhodospirillum sp.]MCF8502967.1 flagellar hook-associated protein FlgK [Rhodospirillum sp.]
MSLNLALSAGISGLQTSQKGLDLVGHNLANVNTVGYTRKTFNPESVVLNGRGVGVQTGGITRSVNAGLNEELRSELATYTELNTKDTYFQRMQDLFGTPAENSSISHKISLFAQEFETLSLEPDKSTQHLSVTRYAQELTQKFNNINDKLQEMRLNADQDIASSVTEINNHLSSIDTLNEQITQGIASGQDVTDLQDKRDTELLGLQKLIDVTSFERSGGALVIYTTGGTTLLDTDPVTVSHAASTSVSATDSYGGSDFAPITANGQDITAEIGQGKLAGLIEMRDKTIPSYQAQMDELSAKLKETVNQINNRGTSYPSVANTYDGTTKFIAPSTQTMELTNGDVQITVFDKTGAQAATAPLSTIMDGSAFSPAQADLGASGPWTVEQVAARVSSWLNDSSGGGLTGASFAYDTNTGTYDIDLKSNDYSLAFRDQASSTTGSTAGDVTISYDKNGDGTADETVMGFSSFFGLNDMFVSSDNQWLFDSDVKSANWTPNVNGTLQFSVPDATAPGTNPPTSLGTLTVQGGWSLSDIAAAINNNSNLSANLEAEVVQDGEGYRLRIKNRAGDDMEITQTGGTGLITQLGLDHSDAGLSGSLALSSTLVDDPSRLSRGAVLFNSDTGEYYVSAGDNTTANQMAKAFQTPISFDTAGGLTTGQRTLSDYAALSLSQNASEAASVETSLDYQATLADTIDLKVSEVSGVNMDEELAQLLVWEQMYNASAKVISTVADMLDVLNSIIR